MYINSIAEPCIAGFYLDLSIGCQTCPRDTYSVAGNTAAQCTACPDGKRVDAGAGTKESDCEWRESMFDCSFLNCDKNYSTGKHNC